MQSILSTEYTWQTFSVFIIVLSSLYRAAKSENNGILTFEFVCYENPGHLDSNGKRCDSIPSINCDPYFTICISNQRIVGNINKNKCGIYYQETSPYDNHDLVCKTPTENRGTLRNIITRNIDLRRQGQSSIHVKIDATDSDQWSSYQTPIASFVTELSNQSPLNSANIKYYEINMVRSETRNFNPKASMKIRIGLHCAKNLHGKNCETVCQTTASSSYTCSELGEKICKEGWKGRECQAKDLCLYQLCAKGATCIEKEDEAKCQCDGNIGPQCYPNYNPCATNLCRNKGECVPDRSSKNDFHCLCTFPFNGSRCEVKLDACTVEPCLNNATCEYDENKNRQCICNKHFYGTLCDKVRVDLVNDTTSKMINHHQKMGSVNNRNKNLILAFIIFFSILLVALAVTITFFVIKRRRDRGFVFFRSFEQQVHMKDLEGKSPTLSVISNDYYIAQN